VGASEAGPESIGITRADPFPTFSQQYIGVSTPLAGIILNPAPLLAARQLQRRSLILKLSYAERPGNPAKLNPPARIFVIR
jgi:hypothetical protein